MSRWQLRQLDRKVYNDEGLDDDEIDGKRTFDVLEKLNSDKYNDKLVKVVNGEDINVKYFQEHGFKQPLLVKEKTGLGIRVPGNNFTVEEVKKCVGSRRMIDVLDVTTQKAMEMTMKDWVKYYENKADRTRLLNVLSLECSHSRLENYVEQPEIVKQIDWVDNVWPRHLKDKQTETTNILDKMHYPKVQRYCLMSVKGCYTDFHIDMGGTSVWYHILHGAKVFWLIPPTEENLSLYEEWVLSGKQGDDFFADKVEKCQRLRLEEGWTFFIPTGWIHGVYTPEDSLVFGGNYIHSFNMSLQLRIWEVENKTHVPMKFRYPFFTEMHWYVLDRYVTILTGKSYRNKPSEELKEEAGCDELKKEPMSPVPFSEKNGSNGLQQNYSLSPESQSRLDQQMSFIKSNGEPTVVLSKCVLNGNSVKTEEKKSGIKVHLSKYELEGLGDIVAFLQNLAVTKKFVPKDIVNPEGLLEESKAMLLEHSSDNPDFAVTGEIALKWAPRKDKKPKVRNYTTHFQTHKIRRQRDHNKDKGSGGRKLKRRVRCKQCEPCTREDCQLCHFCKDMKKFGGPGVMKQCCLSRQCIAPVLPKTAECTICYKDKPLKDPDDLENKLMECGLCYEIVHPSCFTEKNPEITSEGQENEDLPNSWECPKCVESGKQGHVWKKEYPKAPGQDRLKLGRRISEDSGKDKHDGGTPSPVKKERSQNLSISDQQSHSPTGSLSSSVSTLSSAGSVKLSNSHQYEKLQQVTVQIERLKDFDCLSNSSTSQRKECTLKKIDSPPPKFALGKISQQSSLQQRNVNSLPKTADTTPVKSTEIVSPKEQGILKSPVLRERRLTRSSSVQSDCSQENKTPPVSRSNSSSECSTPTSTRSHTPSRHLTNNQDSSNSSKRNSSYKTPVNPDNKINDFSTSLNEKKSPMLQENHGRLNGRSTPIVKRYPRRTRSQDDNVEHNSDDEQIPKKKMRKTSIDGKSNTQGNSPIKVAEKPSLVKSPTIKSPVVSSSEDSPVDGDNHTSKKAGSESVKGQRPSQRSTLFKPGNQDNGDYDFKSEQNFIQQVQPRFNSLGGNDAYGGNSSYQIQNIHHETQHLKPCKVLVQKHVFGPETVSSVPKYVMLNDERYHTLDQAAWMCIFKQLHRQDLLTCLQVCKTWYRWALDHSLWSSINLSNIRIRKAQLVGIVKRQPISLDLSCTNISYIQLEWLLQRLPNIKKLNMTGNSWIAVSALCTAHCQMLTHLDLSWVSGIYDLCIQNLVLPKIDHQQARDDHISKFSDCRVLSVTGSEITSTGLNFLSKYLPKLERLILSSCARITDEGLAALEQMMSLIELDISKCRNLTPYVLEYVKNIPNLRKLNIMACPRISEKDIGAFTKEIGGKYLRKPCVVLIRRNSGEFSPSAINLEGI